MSSIRLFQITLATAILAVLASPGCARVATRKADLDRAPDGIRVYPPKVFLFVDTQKARSRLIYAPDYEGAYDVKPVTILAAHEFKIDVEEGQVKSLTSNADTTGLLSLLKEGSALAERAAGPRASGESFEGTFGLEDGIYVLEMGRFIKLEAPHHR